MRITFCRGRHHAEKSPSGERPKKLLYFRISTSTGCFMSYMACHKVQMHCWLRLPATTLPTLRLDTAAQMIALLGACVRVSAAHGSPAAGAGGARIFRAGGRAQTRGFKCHAVRQVRCCGF